MSQNKLFTELGSFLAGKINFLSERIDVLAGKAVTEVDRLSEDVIVFKINIVDSLVELTNNFNTFKKNQNIKNGLLDNKDAELDNARISHISTYNGYVATHKNETHVAQDNAISQNLDTIEDHFVILNGLLANHTAFKEESNTLITNLSNLLATEIATIDADFDQRITAEKEKIDTLINLNSTDLYTFQALIDFVLGVNVDDDFVLNYTTGTNSKIETLETRINSYYDQITHLQSTQASHITSNNVNLSDIRTELADHDSKLNTMIALNNTDKDKFRALANFILSIDVDDSQLLSTHIASSEARLSQLESDVSERYTKTETENGFVSHDGIALSSQRLSAERTLMFSGDVQGEGLFNGTKNVNFELRVKDNSHIHDARYYNETEMDDKIATIDASIDDVIDTHYNQTVMNSKLATIDASIADVIDTHYNKTVIDGKLATIDALADTHYNKTTMDTKIATINATTTDIINTHYNSVVMDGKLTTISTSLNTITNNIINTHYNKTSMDTKIATINSSITDVINTHYNKTMMNSKLATIDAATADVINTHYNKTSMDNKIITINASIDDVIDTHYNQTVMNSKLATIDASIADVIDTHYNKTVIDGKLATIDALADTHYNKTTMDNKISTINSSITDVINTHYNSTVMDGKLSTIDDKISTINTSITNVISTHDSEIANVISTHYNSTVMDTKIATINTTINTEINGVTETHYNKNMIDSKISTINSSITNVLETHYNSTVMDGKIATINTLIATHYNKTSIDSKISTINTSITNVDSKFANYLLKTHDTTLTLSGDASGSATFTNLGNATLSIVIANDSHTHDTRYYTESEMGSTVAATSSGASKVGTYDQFGNSNSSNVQGVLDDLDQAITNTNNRDPIITLYGAVTGSGTMTNLGNVSISTTSTADPTLTLSGDASGSATFTNLGNATLSVTVANDSHTHNTQYYTETEIDSKITTINALIATHYTKAEIDAKFAAYHP